MSQSCGRGWPEVKCLGEPAAVPKFGLIDQSQVSPREPRAGDPDQRPGNILFGSSTGSALAAMINVGRSTNQSAILKAVIRMLRPAQAHSNR